MDIFLGAFSPRGGSDSDSGSDQEPTPQCPGSPSRPMRGAMEDLSELAQAQNVLSVAARTAGSFLRSLQAAIQTDNQDFQEGDAADGSCHWDPGAPGDDPRLPWVPLSPDEKPFARQLRARMMSVADEPGEFLEQSLESCSIDVAAAITEAAGAALEHDPKLRGLRFRLVPKHISEEVFWARYFGICNRIRKEVLLEGVTDSQVLGKAEPAEEAVHVPLSPEASLTEGRFRRPEATEAAGRWLETAEGQSQPPGPCESPAVPIPRSGGLPPKAAVRKNHQDAKPPLPKTQRIRRDDSESSLWGLMAGEDGGMTAALPTAASPAAASSSLASSSTGSFGASLLSSGVTSPEMGRSGVLQCGSSLGSASSSSQALDNEAASAVKTPTQTPQAPAANKGKAAAARPPPLMPPAPAGPLAAPLSSQRLRKMADTLAAARLLCLEDMARLNISPPAARAEATGTWGGAILRAVGAGRGGAAAAAVVASVADQPQVTQQPGFPSRRRLRLSQAGSSKALLPDSGCSSGGREHDDREDQVMAAVWELFDPMSQGFAALSPRMCSPGAGGHSQAVPWGLPSHDAGVELTGWSLESEVGGAPPNGLLAAAVSSLCRLATVGQMAQFWSEVVEELQCHWRSLRPVPGIPADQPPDLGVCLLQQRLQLLNIAITDKRAWQQQQQQQQGSAAAASREGTAQCLPGLPLSDGSGPVWSPQLQRAVAFHQDLCLECPPLSQCLQGPPSTLRQALSDMSAFRAANPTALPCDYEAWCGAEGRPLPRQLLGPLLAGTPSSEFYPLRHVPKHHRPARHHQLHPGLSSIAAGSSGGFQLHHPTTWEDLFWSAPPLPAWQQVPLFDSDTVGSAVLKSIGAMVPSDIFEQLFLVSVVAEHASAAASPLLHTSVPLETALHEVRCFVAAACGRGMSESKVKRICNVFERLQDMFEAVAKEQQDGTSGELSSSSYTGSAMALVISPTGSLMSSDNHYCSGSFMDVEDEWTMV